MPDTQLQAAPRTVLGKAVGRLRRSGILPAVIYGKGDSIPIQVDLRAFEHGYRIWGRTTLLTLTGIDGDIPALVTDVARDPRTGRLLHADFFRVSLTEKVHAEVPLHFVGESPAVKNLSAVLLHAMAQLRVEAFPQDIPRRIDVDLSALVTMDDAVHVRDVQVDATKIKLLDDPDNIVVKVIPQRAEEEVAPPPAAVEGEVVPAEGEAAEPAEGEAPAPLAAAKPGEPAQAQAKQPAQQQEQKKK